MKSLRLRLAFWYATSLAIMLVILALATRHHLDYELRQEALEKAHPSNKEWVLHAAFIEPEIEDIMGELLEVWLVVGGPMLVVSVAIGFFLARKSVRPIQELNAQLGGIGPNSLGTRLSVADSDPYIQQLVSRINELLARVGEGYERLGAYSVTVAHELRTPLMLMRLQIESATDSIAPQLAEDLQDDLARLSSYVERTLLSARAEQGQLEVHATDTDLSAMLADLAEGHVLMARERQRDIRLELEPGILVSTDPALFRQIFDNLVVNALQHGRGPVRIRLRRRSRGTILLIANACATAAGHHGNGIGLRLVQALTDALPGTSFHSHSGATWHGAALRWL